MRNSHPPVPTDRREEIRTKARDLFIRHGYRKTTVEDIGRACGLGKAALYRYFSDKEAIFADVIRVESESLLAKLRNVMKDDKDPKSRLAALIRTRFRVIRSFTSAMAYVEELEEILPRAAEIRQVYFKQEAQLVRDILEEGERKGVFKPQRLDLIPHLFISAIQGLERHFAEMKDSPSAEDGLDELLKLLFEGICV